MATHTFVLEIGTEELPTAWVEPALARLCEEFEAKMQAARIAHGPVLPLGTARRLVLIVSDVNARQDDAQREERGPPKSVCIDAAGNPTQAFTGWAQSKGLAVEDVEFRPHRKGDSAFALVSEVGRPTLEVLPAILAELVFAPNFPKTMRWGTRKIRYARPIRWYLALLDDQVVHFETEGIASGRTTRGHRVLGDGALEIADASAYQQALTEQSVIVDHRARRELIGRQVDELAGSVGGKALAREELIDVNLQLVEHPTAFTGSFPERYLELPDIVLKTVMRKAQKYFPIEAPDGSLVARFIAIRDGDENGIDTVRKGNEWVLVGRLDDAAFFYQEDRKRSLCDRAPDLERVVFVEGLGSLADKAKRLGSLARQAAASAGLSDEECAVLARAAELCKVDLTTQMVNEFTDLQGVIGGIYAEMDGESCGVPSAIAEHYRPGAAGDDLPSTDAGCILSIVDKMDHVTGCLSLGLAPKGTGDPQGLRRRTQAMAAIVMERGLSIDLLELASSAASALDVAFADVRGGFSDLLTQRVHAALDRHGIGQAVREAVLVGWDSLHTALARARLLTECLAGPTDDFLAAVRAATRVANIVPKRETDRTSVDPKLFEHASEAPLLAAIEALEQGLAGLADDDFAAMIALFADAADAVDGLFDGPMVMAEDPALRANRLAMLYRAHCLFTRVGDLRKLDVPAQE